MISLNAVGLEQGRTQDKTYEIEVKTSSETGSGTDAKVAVSIYGTEGELLNNLLTDNLTQTNPFETNNIDKFSFQKKNIGKITKINIGHDSSGSFSAWKLDYVKITVNKSDVYQFDAYRWLDTERGDKKTKIDLLPANSTSNTNASKADNSNPFNLNKLANNAATNITQSVANTVISSFDPQALERINRKFKLISKDGSTITLADGILLVRAIGENPSKKEYQTALEELKLTNKEKLEMKDSLLVLEKLWKREPKSDVEKSLSQAFKRFDKNNDGFIDLKEFEEKMTKTGEQLTSDEFKDLISNVKVDHNGRISYAEFIRLFTQ